MPDSSDTTLESEPTDLVTFSTTIATESAMDEADFGYEYFVPYVTIGAYSSDVNRDDRDNH